MGRSQRLEVRGRELYDSSLRTIVPCYHEFGSLLMMRRYVRAILRGHLAFEFFEASVVFVAFAAGGFDVEHQVLHVEPQLAQGVLNERQDAAASFGALNDAFKAGMKSREYWSGRAWMAETRRSMSAGNSSTGVRKLVGCWASMLLRVGCAVPKCTRCATPDARTNSPQA